MKLLSWQGVGIPDVHHLFEVEVWKPGRAAKGSKLPLCGGRRDAMVYREDGLYCRYCVALEGVGDDGTI